MSQIEKGFLEYACGTIAGYGVNEGLSNACSIT